MAVFRVKEEAVVRVELVNVEVSIREVEPWFGKKDKCGIFRVDYFEKIELVSWKTLNVPCHNGYSQVSIFNVINNINIISFSGVSI